jgi:LEA14-like dessication related protein
MDKRLIYLGLGLVAIGVAAYAKSAYDFSKSVCFKFKSYSMLGVKDGAMGVRFVIAMKNKTDFALKISGYNLKAYLDGKYLGRFKSSQDQTIKPFSEDAFNIDGYFNVKSTIGSVLQSSNIMSSKIKISGVVLVNKLGVPIPMPISITRLVSEITEDSETTC